MNFKFTTTNISNTTAPESGIPHMHFINLETINPVYSAQVKDTTTIRYSFGTTLFGKVIIASTNHGICRLEFIENEEEGFSLLEKNFPKAELISNTPEDHSNALKMLNGETTSLTNINLDIKGTEFQLKVWETLLTIPPGSLTTYGELAKSIGQPGAARAVGTAIGSNPVAYLIPCHRVIQASGSLGGYMWGKDRKRAILIWEKAKFNREGL